MTRLEWVTPGKQLTLSHQCQLVGVSRTTVYARRKPQILREVELLLCRLIDEEYTRRPFYGSRKMVRYLLTAGHVVNRKRVQRMMRLGQTRARRIQSTRCTRTCCAAYRSPG